MMDNLKCAQTVFTKWHSLLDSRLRGEVRLNEGQFLDLIERLFYNVIT